MATTVICREPCGRCIHLQRSLQEVRWTYEEERGLLVSFSNVEAYSVHIANFQMLKPFLHVDGGGRFFHFSFTVQTTHPPSSIHRGSPYSENTPTQHLLSSSFFSLLSLFFSKKYPGSWVILSEKFLLYPGRIMQFITDKFLRTIIIYASGNLFYCVFNRILQQFIVIKMI